LAPLLSKLWPSSEPNRAKNERYSDELKNISSLDKLIAYADKMYDRNKTSATFDTASYVWTLSEIVKDRFYHEDLKYSFSENWIAWLVGKTMWSHVSFIVLSDDILKHSEAICSQQTSVFMEALQKKGISTRSIGLGLEAGPGHYLCEVKYEGSWHLYDVSVEPDWTAMSDNHESLDYYLSGKKLLYKAYESRMEKPLFDKIMEHHSYGQINKLPAPHMKLLHQVMCLATYLIPVFLLLLLIVSGKSVSNERQSKSSTEKTKDDFVLVK
jgi:hypothetical protein